MVILESYKKALKYFSNFFNKAKKKEKFKYLYPIKASGFTMREARRLGFNCSKYLWRKCLNTNDRNLG